MVAPMSASHLEQKRERLRWSEPGWKVYRVNTDRDTVFVGGTGLAANFARLLGIARSRPQSASLGDNSLGAGCCPGSQIVVKMI